jgi:nicotinate-nucleotide pyrophosphorylase (carboxylating)
MAQAYAAHSPALPPRERWCPLVEMALAEDVGPGDLTTSVVLDTEHERQRHGQARIEARSSMIVCGLPVVEEVFRQIDPDLEIQLEPGIEEGVQLANPGPLLRIRGRFESILVGERTALNFLGRLCGVATQTRKLVDLVVDLSTDLVDTRKTTPGWRCLEKYAVAVGGGVNHRIGLYDAVLIKDNHIAAAGGLDAAVKRALAKTPAGVSIQVEVESEAMADRAVELGCDFLLLDNLSPETIRKIVDRHAPGIVLEASGGIGPDNVRRYAETGVARISMGALTHSVNCADVALELDLLPEPSEAAS